MRRSFLAFGCAFIVTISTSNVALAEGLGIFECFEGDGFHPAIVERVRAEMSHPKTFVHIQTRISAGFEDGNYSGKHFLEMLYGGSDVANGSLTARAIATISVEECSIGLFKADAPN